MDVLKLELLRRHAKFKLSFIRTFDVFGSAISTSQIRTPEVQVTSTPGSIEDTFVQPCPQFTSRSTYIYIYIFFLEVQEYRHITIAVAPGPSECMSLILQLLCTSELI